MSHEISGRKRRHRPKTKSPKVSLYSLNRWLRTVSNYLKVIYDFHWPLMAKIEVRPLGGELTENDIINRILGSDSVQVVRWHFWPILVAVKKLFVVIDLAEKNRHVEQK